MECFVDFTKDLRKSSFFLYVENHENDEIFDFLHEN